MKLRASSLQLLFLVVHRISCHKGVDSTHTSIKHSHYREKRRQYGWYRTSHGSVALTLPAEGPPDTTTSDPSSTYCKREKAPRVIHLWTPGKGGLGVGTASFIWSFIPAASFVWHFPLPFYTKQAASFKKETPGVGLSPRRYVLSSPLFPIFWFSWMIWL